MKVNIDLEDIASKVDHWERFNRYLILEALEVAANGAQKEALELGCGSGVTTHVYLENFKKVTIVDGSKAYLIRAKERNQHYDNGTYICSFFENLELDKQFDDVIMAHILEHVEDPIRILKASKSWISPKGKIHIIVPNGQSLHRRIGVELGMLSKPEELPASEAERGHRRVYNMERLKQDIIQAGLKIFDSRGFLVKVFPDAVLKVIHQEYIDALFRISRHVAPEICADLYITCGK
jgi:SAM-dependent methyltransferase